MIRLVNQFRQNLDQVNGIWYVRPEKKAGWIFYLIGSRRAAKGVHSADHVASARIHLESGSTHTGSSPEIQQEVTRNPSTILENKQTQLFFTPLTFFFVAA